MKTKLLKSLILMLIALPGYSQSAYYDAIALSSYLDADNKFKSDTTTQKNVLSIIGRYYPEAGRGIGVNDFKNSLTTLGSSRYNNLLDDYFTKDSRRIDGDNTTLDNLSGGGVQNIESSIIYGTADFLIERAKQEVNAAFFQRFKKTLEEYPELKTLFPNTYVIVDNFNNWEYANILSTLQLAFKNDVRELLANAAHLHSLDISECNENKNCIKRIKSIKAFFETNEGCYVSASLLFANGLVNRHKIPDIINELVASGYLGGHADENVRNVVKGIAILSNAVRSNKTGESYITLQQLNALLADAEQRKLFFGLIYAQLKAERIKINGVEIWTELESNLGNAEQYYKNVLAKAETFDDIIKRIAEKLSNGEKPAATQYESLITSARGLLIQVADVQQISAKFKLPTSFQQFVTYTDLTLDIAQNLTSDNYHAAVLNLVNILDRIGREDPAIKEYVPQVLKYGSFAANMATAEDPEQVAKAIEAVALPSGSFIMKQQSAFNISVNGFLGYCWDYRRDKTANSTYLHMHGIYAPVGISASWGFSKKAWGAVGLFASIIDIGGVASYRLTSGEADTLQQQVRLESVFSPSAQLAYYVPKLPISVMAGWRLTPKLFYKNESGFIAETPVNTFNVSVLVDIPMFTLYNLPFKN